MADKKEKDLTALAQSSSVTNDSFIRMIDKDGKSVKIARDIFLQAIRDALPGVLSSLGGTANHILAKTTNGGIGYETLANAASLLGVSLVKNDGTPLSELTATGRYFWLNSEGLPSDFPSELIVSSTKAGILEVFVFGSQILQRFTHYRNVIFQRTYVGGSWNEWVRVTTTSA